MCYEFIIVESFQPVFREASSNKVRIRPLFDQGEFKRGMRVACNDDLKNKYKVGTKFKIKAKVTDNLGTKFIYSNYNWDYEVLD